MSIELAQVNRLMKKAVGTPWPDTFTPRNLAYLQTWTPAIDRKTWNIAAAPWLDALSVDCNDGVLPHTTTTERRMVAAARDFHPDEFGFQSNARFPTIAGRMYAYTEPAKYKDITNQHILAADFARWLTAQGEQPSRLLAAWFKSQRVSATAAPAPVEFEPVPEFTGGNGKVIYEVSLDELMDIKAARNRIEARAAARDMQAEEDEKEVFEAIARQREYSSQPDTPGEPELKTEAEAWQVHKPQRFGAYAAPLYRLLNNAHQAGKPRPTARDVLEAWRTDTPAEVAMVLTDGIDYYDSNGNTKSASIAAIKEAITRMTKAR